MRCAVRRRTGPLLQPLLHDQGNRRHSGPMGVAVHRAGGSGPVGSGHEAVPPRVLALRDDRSMSDGRLLGYWSDDVLYQGSMEAADIAFAPHEAGWIYWARDGGVFTVDRFTWHTTGRRRLQLRTHRCLSGNWTVREGRVYHRVDEQYRCNDTMSFAYTIGVGRDATGDAVTVLELDRPVSVGTVGERFAFKHGGVRGKDDPTRQRRRRGRPSGT